ncbi:MAG: ribbon-helix-helix domain-containing protein [Thermoplasmatota archaeon]
MSKMVPVDVQFTQEELEWLDRYLEKRRYESRSDYIRDVVRIRMMEEMVKEFQQICNEKGITVEEMVETMKKVREESWGED